jgi:hypothetical protein
MGTFPLEQVTAGHSEYQRLIDEGHVDHWQREWQSFTNIRSHIDKLLN